MICSKCHDEFTGKVLQNYCSWECCPWYERYRWVLILLPFFPVLRMTQILSDFLHPIFFWLGMPMYIVSSIWLFYYWWNHTRGWRSRSEIEMWSDDDD